MAIYEEVRKKLRIAFGAWEHTGLSVLND